MLSRVADSFYWMCRYIERADNVARFIDVNCNLSLGGDHTIDEQWAPLIYTTGDETDFQQRYTDYSPNSVLHFLAFDRENPNSVLSCVEKARENARSIRENISSAVWEELNVFYHLVRGRVETAASWEGMQRFCHEVKRASHVFVGATEATMSHGEAWHFGQLGRLIERADKTSRIVDVQYFLLLPEPTDIGSSLDVVRWSALLKSAGALEMYRRVYGRIVPTHVANFLILDREFPRSVHYCLIHAHQSLNSVTGSVQGTFRTRAEQQLGRLRSEMDYSSIEEIISIGMHEFIDRFQTQLNQVGAAVFEDFFKLQTFEASPPASRTPQPVH